MLCKPANIAGIEHIVSWRRIKAEGWRSGAIKIGAPLILRLNGWLQQPQARGWTFFNSTSESL
ncbi:MULTISPECIES: hypothetical protein [Pseudomonas]|jgi:hypothetical protein|uniref:Uncharacterized protein n=1 Tax=Pseudomonas gingeri TaxID=117681 RepID=A0A7Y7WD70_9PSED|nr:MULTISPECIES: hypothetical protein [Pseudomonas]MCU1738402.1 hypothetical protein [Pseudomonas sp. 20S_6.2_Bac1]NWB46464.1 hypothetical protein [Pseudomonas gingeri]